MKRLILLLIFLCGVAIISAHPHMFIEFSIEPVFSENGLEGLNIEWIFDEMFSWQVAMDYTEDKDFNLTEAEQKILEKEAFSYLSESDYFAEFFHEDERFIVKTVSDFSAEYREELLVYHYYIPWKVAFSKELVHLKICFFDDTMFCELVPSKKGLVIPEIGFLETEYSMPDRVTYQLNFRKK